MLRLILRYALEKSLDIEEWEKWSDSPFSFNGVPKDHRNVSQVVIYYDYKEINIYTKEYANSSLLNEIQKLGLYSVHPTKTYNPKDERIRHEPKENNGLLIIIHY